MDFGPRWRRPPLGLPPYARPPADQPQFQGRFASYCGLAIDFPPLAPMFRLRLVHTEWPPIRTKSFVRTTARSWAPGYEVFEADGIFRSRLVRKSSRCGIFRGLRQSNPDPGTSDSTQIG